MEISNTAGPALSHLVARLREVLQGDPALDDELGAVQSTLEAQPPTVSVLAMSQRQADPDQLTSRVIHAEPAFSIVALVMAPGHTTTIHDHLTWCVVTVLAGTEHETAYTDCGDHLEVVGSTLNVVDTVTGLAPPGDIHQVENQTGHTVISLHVYGVDVRRTLSSVRRTYTLPVLDPADSGRASVLVSERNPS